ncbi:MAG: citramalate synthase, partial [Anaerolineae bacterium]|nr:citramalate synthase [Anaerolineae bacterium]
GYEPLFKLIEYTTIVEQRPGRGTEAEAMVKIEMDGEIAHTAAEGNGPVNALDEALRKAMRNRYPRLDDFHLVDYKVRILDGASGTAATTRVLIDTLCGTRRWSTVGAGTNIIQASWLALVDSVEYGLRIVPPAARSETQATV